MGFETDFDVLYEDLFGKRQNDGDNKNIYDGENLAKTRRIVLLCEIEDNQNKLFEAYKKGDSDLVEEISIHLDNITGEYILNINNFRNLNARIYYTIINFYKKGNLSLLDTLNLLIKMDEKPIDEIEII